jgi:hypothetical protein
LSLRRGGRRGATETRGGLEVAMWGARRLRETAFPSMFGVLVLAAATAASGEFGLRTWPPSFAWHTFHGSGDPESGGEVAADGASRVTTIGLSYAAWLGPAGQAPLRAFTAGQPNAFVVQIDRDGAYRWHSFFPCSIDGISTDGVGNLYLTGGSWKSWTGPAGQPPLHAHPGGASAIVVAKVDVNGTYLWHTFYGSGHSNYNNGGNAVTGEVWVTGFTSGGGWTGPAGQPPLAPFTGLQAAFVLKLSPTGAYQWHAFFGAGSENGYAVGIDKAGDGIVLGSSLVAWNGPSGQPPLHPYTGGPQGTANLFVLKLRGADGAYRWHTFYGTGADSGRGLAVLGSEIYVTGSSGAAWNGPGGRPPRNPYLAQPADPNVILALQLRGDGAYAWHAFFGSGGNSGNAIATDGLSLFVAADSWAAWKGPAGEPPSTPFSGWSSAALLALTTGGTYRGHGFIGTSTGAEGVAIREGAVYLGGTAGATWNGPADQAPRHAYANSGDVVVVKVVPATPSLILSDEGAGLIAAMVGAGRGGDSVFAAVVALRDNAIPALAEVIGEPFVAALATCPADSAVFATPLGEIAAGTAIAVSSDCTVQPVAESGRSRLGQPGSSTLAATLPGIGAVDLTHATTEAPLVTWQAGGTTYNAFAIAWTVRHGAMYRRVSRR